MFGNALLITKYFIFISFIRLFFDENDLFVCKCLFCSVIIDVVVLLGYLNKAKIIVMEKSSRKYLVQLSFEEIRLPPFEDILVLGKKSPQGKIGLSRSFELMVPNEFEVFELEHNVIEAVFINKRLLKKMDKDRIIAFLDKKVFPFVSECEILRVDFKIKILYDTIEEEM